MSVPPELEWDDFKGEELTGKVLLVIVNQPQVEPFPAEDMHFTMVGGHTNLKKQGDEVQPGASFSTPVRSLLAILGVLLALDILARKFLWRKKRSTLWQCMAG